MENYICKDQDGNLLLSVEQMSEAELSRVGSVFCASKTAGKIRHTNRTASFVVVAMTARILPTDISSADCVQLFLGHFIPGFLCQGKEFFRGLRCFDLFLLLVGEGAEDVSGNVHEAASFHKRPIWDYPLFNT